MEKADSRKTLVLENRIGELETIRSKLRDILLEWEIPPSLEFTLNLAMEEAFTNVVHYAFSDSKSHEIELQFQKQGNKLVIIFSDDGNPFDPTAIAEPDISLPARDRPIGGLGIYLVRKMMDQVEYRRENNKNQLILTKQINP